MRRATLAAFLVSATIVVAPESAIGCGDKLVDLSRGVRFQRANAGHRESIVLLPHVNSGRRASIVLFLQQGPNDSANKIKSSLTRAGHNVEIVNDSVSLKKTLAARDRDLVVTELGEVPSVKKVMATSSSKALVIPLVRGPATEQIAATRGQYEFVLSSPGTTSDLILTIDKAIKSIAVTSTGSRP